MAALPGAAVAHEGAARLILDPDRVNPGGVVVVRGEDLGADDEMRVALVGGTGRTELATITSDGQGHFSVAIQVSAEAPVGVYAVEAVGPSGVKLTAAMFVEGAPVIEGGGAPPGQDEGLPAILPSAGGQVVSGPMATIRPISASTGGPTSEVDLVPFLALAGALGALGLLFWRTRRPPVAPTGSADLP